MVARSFGVCGSLLAVLTPQSRFNVPQLESLAVQLSNVAVRKPRVFDKCQIGDGPECAGGVYLVTYHLTALRMQAGTPEQVLKTPQET